jgi:hypothetical protein
MAITLGQVKPTIGQQSPAAAAQQRTDLQLQQAAGAATQQGLTPQKSQIQATAGQVAQVKGQEQIKEQQQQVQQAQQQRQVQASEQKVQKVKQLMQTKQELTQKSMQNSQALDSLQMNLRQEYVDKVTKFKKDEIGRTVFNERQLADWAATKARNEEDYAEYEQAMLQAIEKKNAVMEQAFKTVSRHLEQEFIKAEQAKDQAAMEQIAGIRNRIAKEQAEARKKAAQSASLWTTGGTLLGIAAGVAITVSTGGTGAAAIAAAASAGGSAGGAFGNLGYSQFGD